MIWVLIFMVFSFGLAFVFLDLRCRRLSCICIVLSTPLWFLVSLLADVGEPHSSTRAFPKDMWNNVKGIFKR